MYVVTIDTGTTNTRVTIWKDKLPIYIEKREVGVRISSIEKSNKKLLDTVKDCLDKALSKCNLGEEDIAAIIASGMISSELGLCEIERVPAPVSLRDLANHCVKKNILEVSRIHPIWFIPGIMNKNNGVNEKNCEMMDIMRGEEVETFGIIQKEKIKGPIVLILPGSHTKFVYVNEENKIQGCVTTMAGEILMELTRSSIISSSLNSSFVEEIEDDWIEAGAYNCEETGLNRSVFLIRILDLFTNATDNQKANFLLGVMIADDIKALFNSQVYDIKNDCTILISGTNSYTHGFAHFLKKRKEFMGNIKVVSREVQDNIAGYGAITVMEQSDIFLDWRE